MELQHILARKRAIILALILWCLVLGLGMAYLFSQRNDVLPNAPVVKNAVMKAADNAAAKYQGMALRPNMLATVAVVFDKTNSQLVYIPAVDSTSDGSQVITESSLFETSYASYDFLLHSTASKENDSTYITDYLTLTVTEHTQGGDVKVTYTDKGADGGLDAAYVDGVLVTDPSLYIAAQDQYTAELVVSRNYLLGLTTEK